jgi:hypothetical protein
MMPLGLDRHKIEPGGKRLGRSCPAYIGDGCGEQDLQRYSAAAFWLVAVPRAWSRSAMMSSICSMPTDRRT